MRAVKAILVIVGVFIIAGFVFIGVEVHKRVNDPERVARLAAAAGPRLVGLGLPAGARIVETALADNRLALRVALPDGGERVFLIDARDGEVDAVIDAAASTAESQTR